MATPVKRKRSREIKRRQSEHRSAEQRVGRYREHMIAYSTPIEDLPDVDPAEAMQLMINRVQRLWRYAAAQVDALRPGAAHNQSGESMDHELWVTWDENMNLVVTSSYWIAREEQLSLLLARLTESAQKLGLAERRTRVAEGQVQLLGEALQAACKVAGLTEPQQKQLGAALRTELAVIEGAAMEIRAA